MARRAPLSRWTRVVLLLMAAGLAGVFAVAAWIHPYDADGLPRTLGTHRQLGLPPCSMIMMLGKPCPSCGMTTAFALLVRGDVSNSLRANWAGTLIALIWLALIPWSIASAIRARYYGIRSVEVALTACIGIVLALMMIRWAFVMLT